MFMELMVVANGKVLAWGGTSSCSIYTLRQVCAVKFRFGMTVGVVTYH